MNMRTFSCSYILLLLCFEVDERFRLLLLFNNFLITSMVKKKINMIYVIVPLRFYLVCIIRDTV